MQATFDIDIHALLAEHRQIALIWEIDDVLGIRPDLNPAQAWELLKLVERRHDANFGVCWETLEWVAQDLFGDVPETDEPEEE